MLDHRARDQILVNYVAEETGREGMLAHLRGFRVFSAQSWQESRQFKAQIQVEYTPETLRHFSIVIVSLQCRNYSGLAFATEGFQNKNIYRKSFLAGTCHSNE